MAHSSCLYQFRLILIGDVSGKSCLLRHFVEGTFYQSLPGTHGVDLCYKLVHVDAQPIKLQIWDVAGSEPYRGIVRNYFRSVVGGLLCYDVTNRKSFEGVGDWLEDAKRNAEPHKPAFVLVGTKADQEDSREVSKEEGIEFAQDHGMDYMETSAKTGLNVEEAFMRVAGKIFSLVCDGVIKTEEGWDGVKRGDVCYRRTVTTISDKSVSLKIKGKGKGNSGKKDEKRSFIV